jgi:hypothetical protein
MRGEDLDQVFEDHLCPPEGGVDIDRLAGNPSRDYGDTADDHSRRFDLSEGFDNGLERLQQYPFWGRRRHGLPKYARTRTHRSRDWASSRSVTESSGGGQPWRRTVRATSARAP